GPYLRLTAKNVDIGVGGVTVHADVSFDQIGPAGSKIIRIGLANASIATGASGVTGDNPGLLSAQGALIVFPVGAHTDTGNPGTTTTSGGIAGIITGTAQASAGAFAGSASVGVAFNTTGVHVHQSIDVAGTTLLVDVAATPTVSFIVQNLSFDFGGILEIRAGQFAISAGQFTGTGLEIFVGHGPLKLADGTDNQDAIGIVVRNATLAFKQGPSGGFAIQVTGDLALLGLDGLTVSGRVSFLANTSTSDILMPDGTTTLTAGRYAFAASNVVISVAGVFTIQGTLGLTREPNGDLDITLAPISVLITISGRNVASLRGFATFTISSVTGFHLVNFKVDDFSLFPPTGQAPSTTTAPTLFPTASLANPLKGAVVSPANAGTSIDITFNDVNGVGLRAVTITDPDPEFDLLLNGSPAAGITVAAVPTLLSGTTYRYALSTTLAQGLWTVRLKQGTFSDNGGATNMSADQQFVVFAPSGTATSPGPVATLANPSGGGTITAAQINAQGYIDVTWTSLPTTTGATPDPILKTSFGSSVAPFTITGTGVADLARDGSNAPILLGAPLLIAGFAATATSVTYRYFLKDLTPTNATPMFGAGNVLVSFLAGAAQSGATGSPVQSAASTQSFTISPSAPGASTTGGPIALGPLTLQGPSIGLADFGFSKDGMVVLTIALGVDRASLNFGGSATNNTTSTSTQQASSGVSVNLLGILGTFDLKVDVLGLLSGNVRIAPTGKWNLRVSSLNAEIPNVATLSASGINIGYDPAAGPGQKLVVINTAVIDVPRFKVRGSLSPYDPTSHSNIARNNDQPLGAGLIPGLVIRDNGFDLGTAELDYFPGGAPSPNALTPTDPSNQISFGGILVLNDIRVGVSGLSVTFGSSVDFTGQIWIATGGAQLFPGKAFSATLSDRNTADDRNPDGTPNTEAFRIALTFTDGRVDSFQMTVDTLTVQLGSYVTLTARDFRLDTGAAGTTQEMISFQSVGATVTISSLVISGEARNFGFLGDGTFVTHAGFGVFLSVGSATGDSFKWPSFLPVRIDSLGIEWADIQNAPGDFVLTLSATVTGIQGLGGLTFTGSVQGVRIQPSLLAQGKFPIIAIDSFGVTVHGSMFGGTIDAGLIGGILRLDSSYQIIGTFDQTTPVFKRVFYVGIQGGFTMAGLGGFGIRLGLSELGPLQVFINLQLPTGILLVPQIGLTLNDFTAGVEFFKSLPSIDDPMALRSSAFAAPTDVSADTWLAGLQSQVAGQARAIDANPNLGGFLAAFTAPMTITGSARIYSIFTSQAVFNGQVLVKISTDGKILIQGKLNFANDNVSISGRLYVDLSKIASGSATVLFLADIPDQVRLLTLYGKLKMGFQDSSGNDVTFSTDAAADPVATGTAPTIGVSGPATGDGSVDVRTAAGQTYDFGSGAHHYVDITYT
ncbi:MAG: hypothetical protein ABI187_02615, partial [Ornithinibacter sp.]